MALSPSSGASPLCKDLPNGDRKITEDYRFHEEGVDTDLLRLCRIEDMTKPSAQDHGDVGSKPQQFARQNSACHLEYRKFQRHFRAGTWGAQPLKTPLGDLTPPAGVHAAPLFHMGFFSHSFFYFFIRNAPTM
jgi:hypothetical protein